MTVNFDFLDNPDPLTPRPYLGVPKESTESVLAKRLEEGFLAAVLAAKVRDWNSLAQDWVQHGWNGERFRNEVSLTFHEVFSEIASAVLVEAAFHGNRVAQEDFTANLPPDQKVVTAWGQVYSNAQAARLALGSELAIADIVNSGINARLPANVLAERARQAYGLDQRSNNTLTAYLTNKILPKNQTVLEVAARLLIQRSRLMADNEVFAALNFGRQITYMDAIERGILEPEAMKTWVTALDERVCPTCRPMDGVSVPIDQAFTVVMPLPKTGRGRNRKSEEFIVPPVHPLCRCTIVPTERYEHGIITRTARYDEDRFHRGRLFSDAGDLVFQKGLFDETEHRRDEHGKFRRYATDAAIVGALGAAGLKTATGRNVVIHVIGEKRYFGRIKPMTSPFEGMPRATRHALRDQGVREAFSATRTQLDPLMNLSDSTNFGQHGLYHPDAYKHLQGATHDETLAKVEEYIRHQGVEHGVLIAPTGKIISFSRGNTSSAPVFIPRREMKAFHGRMTWTHNHPHVHGNDIVLSSTDIAALHLAGVHKIRAITPRGVVTQIRVHPSATKEETLDFSKRAEEESMTGALEAHQKRFNYEPFNPDNVNHMNETAAYQSKRMHQFYQDESKKGKFIYSVTQPKTGRQGAA